MAPKSLPSCLDTFKEKPAPHASEQRIVMEYLLAFVYATLAALYGLYLCFTTAKWETLIMTYLINVAATLGTTAGAHRLWTHRTYKATMPLQILLMVMYSLAFQNTAFIWIKDHRQHHKYRYADPHNAKRGFLYSHVGWLLMTKTELVRQKGRTIEMQDIINNPVLMFQKRYALPLFLLFVFALPVVIPVYFWGETLSTAWHIAIFRFNLTTHLAALINSAGHLWGNRPYDKTIQPTQNVLNSFMTLGEGFHNYHHTFPYDYKSAELGNNKLNLTTHFIDFFAWIGWAYDLKSVPEDTVKVRAVKTGDGTNLWGWGDKDMDKREEVMILNNAH